MLQGVLGSVSPADAVVAFRDPLNVGPLWDIDADGRARAEFWNAVEPSTDWVTASRDEASSWATVRDATSIVVWHGPHPSEYLLSLRLAALLPEDGPVLHEVVRPHSRRKRPAFFDAVGIASPEELTSLMGARVPMRDRAARAARWQALCRSTSTYFRALAPDGIVELEANAYDDRIVAACSREWKRTVRVVGEILCELPVGDRVLAWRVRTLVEKGVLVGRGQHPFGVAEVRLAD
jgi:hypothetical protein